MNLKSVSEEQNKLQCSLCSKLLKNLTALKRHEKIHAKDILKTCKYCPEKTFNSPKKYAIHLNELHQERIMDCLICSACGKQFRTRSELTNHISSNCGTVKLHKCEVCKQELMNPGSLYNHMLRHKGECKYMCRFCAKLFLTAGQLKVHERMHTQEKVFVCDICGKGFCHRQSLITHSTLHTGIKPYSCENCGSSFSCIGNLLKHRKTHIECSGIPLTTHRVLNPTTKQKVKINTPANSKLKRTEKQTYPHMHSLPVEELDDEQPASQEYGSGAVQDEVGGLAIGKRNIVCNTANDSKSPKSGDVDIETMDSKLSEGREINKTDSRMEIEDKDNNCGYAQQVDVYSKVPKIQDIKKNSLLRTEGTENFRCGYRKGDTKNNYQYENDLDELVCRDCGKAFTNTYILQCHKSRHHKNTAKKLETYVCERCGKQFRKRSALLRHDQNNCGDGPLIQCVICNKQFSSIHVRKSHMRIHSSEKKLCCTFCGKRFHWKGQLKIHERSHTGEKPFTCLYCPKAFAYRESLVTHSSLHTGIKPHLCEACGSRFSCIGNLIKHKTTHAKTCGLWYKNKSNG